MKNLLTLLFVMLGTMLVSAQDINQYKYIIIPEKFDFSDEVDQYRLNSLTKFLFEKEGYTTLMKNETKPADLKNNPCLGLHTEVDNNSGLFTTKLMLKLVDCEGKVVFSSIEGKTREKVFTDAYQEALRNAFISIEELDYKYEPASPSKTEAIVQKPTVPKKIQEPEVEENGVVEADSTEMTKDGPELSDPKKQLESKSQFLLSGKGYSLKETQQGLGLYQENSSDPIAILIETNGGKSYIYNSLTNQGVAYFDDNGNLIVEYFNKQENKKVTVKYEALD